MSNATNRAVTLIGANKIFSVVGIAIEHDPLGHYKSTGLIGLKAPTLTGLCQQIAIALAEVDPKTLKKSDLR
jgi:hypothetical protein